MIRPTADTVFRAATRGGFVRLSLLFLIALAGCIEPAAPPGTIQAATDLESDGRVARRSGIPLLLVVTQHDCPYCMRLKQEVFRPILLSGDYDERIILRELLIDPRYSLAGFDGKPVNSHDLASSYGATFVPTVLLLDGQGVEVADRLQGINTAEMYGYYLDRAIDAATRRIRQTGAADAD